MRLLNVYSRKLETFQAKPPKYAILSHTWDQKNDEVTYQDLRTRDDVEQMINYAKIAETCRLAEKEKIEHVWIDTCCIDKSSSAELSEAINSMFRWYQGAEICFAHLEDLPVGDDPATVGSAFKRCRWFTRGWTLQELLAPRKVVFFNRDWEPVGTRNELAEGISACTFIPQPYLEGRDFRHARVGKRLSWASTRETIRIEDLAYCLFGIFGVNMPLLYGEGKKAFERLQQEIMKTSDDDSILAWTGQESSLKHAKEMHVYNGSGPFATSPKQFWPCRNISDSQLWEPDIAWETTSRGLKMTVPIMAPLRFPTADFPNPADGEIRLIPLNATMNRNADKVLAIRLARTPGKDEYERRDLAHLELRQVGRAGRETLYIRHTSLKHLPSCSEVDTEKKNWVRLGSTMMKISPGIGDFLVSISSTSSLDFQRLGIDLSRMEFEGATWMHLRRTDSVPGEHSDYALVVSPKSLFDCLISWGLVTSNIHCWIQPFHNHATLPETLMASRGKRPPSSVPRRCTEKVVCLPTGLVNVVEVQVNSTSDELFELGRRVVPHLDIFGIAYLLGIVILHLEEYQSHGVHLLVCLMLYATWSVLLFGPMLSWRSYENWHVLFSWFLAGHMPLFGVLIATDTHRSGFWRTLETMIWLKVIGALVSCLAPALANRIRHAVCQGWNHGRLSLRPVIWGVMFFLHSWYIFKLELGDSVVLLMTGYFLARSAKTLALLLFPNRLYTQIRFCAVLEMATFYSMILSPLAYMVPDNLRHIFLLFHVTVTFWVVNVLFWVSFRRAKHQGLTGILIDAGNLTGR